MRVMQFGGLYGARICYAPPDGGAGAADYKAIKQALDEVGLNIKQVTADVKKHGETLQTEIKNLGDATKETKEKVDKALTDSATNAGRLQELEQAMGRLRNAGGRGDDVKSAGQQVIASDEWKNLDDNRKRTKFTLVVPVKNLITSLTTDADGSAGDAVAPDRRPGILVPATRRMTIRDLLMPGRTNSNLIEYVKESGFTNNAGPQAGGAEGGAKPESTLKLELVPTAVKTIAHFMRASKQILDDAPALQSHIDFRLRYGLMLEEERQLLSGDGNGGELLGLIPQSTPFSAEFTPDDATLIDTLRLAMLQAALAEWPATGHVLHPTDWARIELTKDSEGRYIFANPQQLAGPTLWGLPVVATQAIDEDKFLTGAFVPAAQVFDREQSNVQVSTEDADNFTKNLVTIRAEERLALAVYREEALIYGDLGNVS